MLYTGDNLLPSPTEDADDGTVDPASVDGSVLTGANEKSLILLSYLIERILLYLAVPRFPTTSISHQTIKSVYEYPVILHGYAHLPWLPSRHGDVSEPA